MENPHPQFVKESAKTVDMFIRTAGEQKIKKFFMEDIDQLLSKYAPGEPVMKQDVLKQMREIDAERQKMAAQMQQQQQILQPGQPIPPDMQPQIMMQEPGKAPVAIGIVDAVNIINQQQQHIKMLEDRIKDLEAKVAARPVSPPKTVGFSDSSESIMLAKGNRSEAVATACKKYGGFYLGSIGGPAARLAQDCIKKVEVLDYEELGMEAVWKIEVENFPAFIIIDDKDNDFYAQARKPLSIGKKPN